MVKTAIVRAVDACSRHAWLVIALALATTGITFTYVARHIAIDTDAVHLFPQTLSWRQGELAFDAAFPQRVKLIAVVIDTAAPELAEQGAARLAARLATQRELFRTVYRPDGGPFFERNGLLFLPTDELSRMTEQLIAAQPLLGSLAADPSLRGVMDAMTLALDGVQRGEARLEDLARPMTVLAEELDSVRAGHARPASWRLLITGEPPKRRELRHFVLVQPVLDFSRLQPGARASDAIRQAARELHLTPDQGVRVRLTGPVALADEEFSTLADGAGRNAAITLLVVVALLWLALRSGRLIIATVASLVVGLMLTAAFGLLVLGAFNVISVSFAVLFVGLGVDFAIQFCVRYRAERHAHDDLHAALLGAARGVGAPLALAAAATATGFYAFLPTAYRGMSELGLIAGTGMLIGFVSCITVLPALIRLLQPPGEPEAIGYAVLAPLDRFLLSRRRAVLIAGALVAAGSIALLPQLRFDFNPLNLRSAKVESVGTLLDLMGDPTTTPNSLDVLAASPAAAVALAASLAALPQVAGTITVMSFVPSDQDKKLALIADAAFLLGPALEPANTKPAPADVDNVRAIQRTAAALRAASKGRSGRAAADAERFAAVLSALAEGPPSLRAQADAALMPGLQATLQQLRTALQAEPVTLDSLPEDLRRAWVAADGRARIEVFPAGNANDNETLRRFVETVRRIAPDVSGVPVSVQGSSRTVVHAFLQAGVWALLSITLLLVIVLRRAADVLLTLAPLLLAGLVTLALCVLLDLPLNFANIIALPLLFGIGVAFNIYFVMAWRAGAANMLQSSLTRAILFSALTTASAFGSLWLSAHPGTASMGRLLALSLACTLASALLFLPALLGPPRRAASGFEPLSGEKTRGKGRDVARTPT